MIMETVMRLVIVAGCTASALIAILFIVKGDTAVNVTARQMKYQLNLFGYEADVRPTPKAKIIGRVLGIFSFLVWLVAGFEALLIF